jgi:serine/threonine-protein kinase
MPRDDLRQLDRCLDPETVRLLISEDLPGPQLARAAAHLGSCHACRDAVVFAAGGPQEPAVAAGRVPARLSHALTSGRWARPGEIAQRPGDVVGTKYRLLSLIGDGGSSSVWRAERMDWRAPVALKLLVPPAQDFEEFAARFDREVRLAAAVRSSHVVQILDQGVDQRSGQPFIAMELLEGETLDQRLKRVARLSPGDTAAILEQVGRALAMAHVSGIVHRDLKPANIFIARELDQEVVKVLDFGVAKSRVFQAGQSLVTTPGTVLGTPCYMSPEQIRASGELDQHADLWSLAVIACECLSGHKPFSGKGFLGVAMAVLEESKRPVPSQLGPVPAGFDAWFARATHLNRSRRFSSAREALDALLPLCEGCAARAQPARQVPRGQSAARELPLRDTAAPGSAPASSLGRLAKYALFAAAVGAAVALWYRRIHQQPSGSLQPQVAVADAISVVKPELAVAPRAAAQAEPATTAEVPPSGDLQPRAPAPASTPLASEPRVAPLGGAKQRARAPRRAHPHARAESVRAPSATAAAETPAAARSLPGDDEQEPLGDGSSVHIDLSP